MRCVKEVLRQKWVLKKSHREVARGLEISSGYVSGVMTRAAATGLTTWAEAERLTELVIEERLYGPKVKAVTARPLPDPAHIHALRISGPKSTHPISLIIESESRTSDTFSISIDCLDILE